jgi:hypothetical protein
MITGNKPRRKQPPATDDTIYGAAMDCPKCEGRGWIYGSPSEAQAATDDNPKDWRDDPPMPSSYLDENEVRCGCLGLATDDHVKELRSHAAGQEWTSEDDYIYEGRGWPKGKCIGRAFDELDAKRICDAHNTSLAAEHKRHCDALLGWERANDKLRLSSDVAQQLEQQLLQSQAAIAEASDILSMQFNAGKGRTLQEISSRNQQAIIALRIDLSALDKHDKQVRAEGYLKGCDDTSRTIYQNPTEAQKKHDAEVRDKIERDLLWSRGELRIELLTLREALEPFAALASEIPTNRQQLGVLTDDHFVNAAAAIKGSDELRNQVVTEVRKPMVDLLLRARRNVEHSASHAAGAASRELLKEIDEALAKAKEVKS